MESNIRGTLIRSRLSSNAYQRPETEGGSGSGQASGLSPIPRPESRGDHSEGAPSSKWLQAPLEELSSPNQMIDEEAYAASDQAEPIPPQVLWDDEDPPVRRPWLGEAVRLLTEVPAPSQPRREAMSTGLDIGFGSTGVSASEHRALLQADVSSSTQGVGLGSRDMFAQSTLLGSYLRGLMTIRRPGG
jgi:hypothetical protein